MKIAIGTDDLRSCLKKFEAIQQRYCYQSDYICITTGNNACTLSATDGLVSLSVVIPCYVETPGNLTVNCKQLSKLLGVLSSEEVEISDLELELQKKLRIKTVTGEYLMYSAHFDRPSTTFKKQSTLTLEGNILLEGVSSTIFSAATDETKTVLCGINLQIKDTLNTFCATNAHHLSEFKIESDINNPDSNFQISNKVCRLLPKLLSPQDKVRISLGQESYVKPDSEEIITYGVTILQFGGTTLKYSLAYSGNFPEYKNLIPTMFERKVIVERQSFIEAIESTSAIAEQSKSSVKITINQDHQEIKVSCECEDVGSSVVSLPAQIAGGSYTYSFHLPYLLGGLKSLKSTEVCISLNAALSPAIIEPLSVQKRKFLIMPQQLRN